MFGIGVVVVVVLAVGLLTLRNFGRRILVRAAAARTRSSSCTTGSRRACSAPSAIRQLPGLGVLTGLDLDDRGPAPVPRRPGPRVRRRPLGSAGAFFVALIGSLLTAVPLSPAGLGIVEVGVVGVLTAAYGVPPPEATAIALLDRVISVLSIIVFGSVAYSLSPKPRGHRASSIAVRPRLRGSA